MSIGATRVTSPYHDGRKGPTLLQTREFWGLVCFENNEPNPRHSIESWLVDRFDRDPYIELL